MRVGYVTAELSSSIQFIRRAFHYIYIDNIIEIWSAIFLKKVFFLSFFLSYSTYVLRYIKKKKVSTEIEISISCYLLNFFYCSPIVSILGHRQEKRFCEEHSWERETNTTRWSKSEDQRATFWSKTVCTNILIQSRSLNMYLNIHISLSPEIKIRWL